LKQLPAALCGEHRVTRIMHEHKIKAVRGYKAPRKIAGRPSIIAPNHLQRQFFDLHAEMTQ